MKLRIVASTFLLVFLAELGDKTQVASFSLAAKTGFPVSVLAGAVAAFAGSTLLAVLASDAAIRILGPRTLRIVSGFLFIAFGAWMLCF